MPTPFRLHLEPGWQTDAWHDLLREKLEMPAGRGLAMLVTHPKGRLLERQYRHGGLRRLWFSEIFFRSGRPRRELEIHKLALDQGVPTAVPVGWAERAGPLPLTRRYFYYTRYLEDAQRLPAFWSHHPNALRIPGAIARILHRLYLAGIRHNDLNLNNWLVREDRVFLIDFDGADRHRQQPESFLANCLARMVRSALKLSVPVSKIAFLRLLSCASRRFDVDPRQVLARIPRRFFHRRAYHAWFWKIFGGHRRIHL